MAKDAQQGQFALVAPDTKAKPDGTIVVHHTVREWQPAAPESLREIEETIDSWGRATATAPVTPTVREEIDPATLAARVDKLTKRVKSRRKEVVTETVTEWVEGPVGSGPIAVEEEPVPAAAPLTETPRDTRPKRRFSLFRRKGKEEAAEPRSKGGKDYQPQCAALTADGAQCRNSSRDGSRYCISHFGYQPPTAKGLAQRIEGDAWDPEDDLTDRESVRSVDTRPAVAKARDTVLRTRKPAKRGRSSRKR